MNLIVEIGNLTKNPTIKKVGDKSVCNFSIAVQRKFNKDKVDYFNVVVWGRAGENAAKYTKKGSQVCVTGSMQNDPYVKDGVKKDYWAIVANDVQFLGGNKRQTTNKMTETEEESPFD